MDNTQYNVYIYKEKENGHRDILFLLNAVQKNDTEVFCIPFVQHEMTAGHAVRVLCESDFKNGIQY